MATSNYDPKDNYYEFILIEGQIRTFAPDIPNVYFLILFACCREIFEKKAIIERPAKDIIKSLAPTAA